LAHISAEVRTSSTAIALKSRVVTERTLPELTPLTRTWAPRARLRASSNSTLTVIVSPLTPDPGSGRSAIVGPQPATSTDATTTSSTRLIRGLPR
jgi:hypothetical protein